MIGSLFYRIYIWCIGLFVGLFGYFVLLLMERGVWSVWYGIEDYY